MLFANKRQVLGTSGVGKKTPGKGKGSFFYLFIFFSLLLNYERKINRFEEQGKTATFSFRIVKKSVYKAKQDYDTAPLRPASHGECQLAANALLIGTHAGNAPPLFLIFLKKKT